MVVRPLNYCGILKAKKVAQLSHSKSSAKMKMLFGDPSQVCIDMW